MYYKMGDGGERGFGKGDGRDGIKKMTEFTVEERVESPSASESDKDSRELRDKRMKPWEHQPHAV